MQFFKERSSTRKRKPRFYTDPLIVGSNRQQVTQRKPWQPVNQILQNNQPISKITTQTTNYLLSEKHPLPDLIQNPAPFNAVAFP